MLERAFELSVMGFSTPGPVFFSVFINDLDEGIEGMLIKFISDMKMEKTANTTEGRTKILNNLDRLEYCTAF